MQLSDYMHHIGADPHDVQYEDAYHTACAMYESKCTDEEVHAYLRLCFGVEEKWDDY